MSISLTTKAEELAAKAGELKGLGSINLLHIKRTIAELLALVGTNEIFDTYTKHDIDHVNEMLAMLDWVIPNDTKTIMTTTDWLLLVLSIYFHDLGMLVTKKEYSLRNSPNSGFLVFKSRVLQSGEKSEEYIEQIKYLSEDEQERFFYQEFVRDKHPERVAMWIAGKAPEAFGVTQGTMKEVDALLSQIDTQFRRDLAVVCESHHLDDLADLTKYRPRRSYGSSKDEMANLQFAAVILRTVDLLHITNDRVPAVVFRLITPSDPITHREWSKQRAVRRVGPKPGINGEGIPDDTMPSDTIEVHAYFEEADGFFGLSSYLLYVAEQLQKSHEWVQLAHTTQGVKHKFPWRKIDDSNIETSGFLKRTYNFQVDEAKILDLLTGHTLYNDPNVVIRELVQNSMDAIRAQRLLSRADIGLIKVHWNNERRILSVRDDGTGMNQDLIEKHLLKVGSSRYQDPHFRKQHPDFSSISRFGIGLLSAFMIADIIDIYTYYPEEAVARHISLRYLHGKYLIRLLDTHTDSIAQSLQPHGTLVQLRVRHSTKPFNIIQVLRQWIVLPECEVFAQIDDEEPVKVGYTTLTEAVHDYLKLSSLYSGKIKIEEVNAGNVNIAYAKRWNDYFQEWSFISIARHREDSFDDRLLGVCVEGIRVENFTPGFSGHTIVAMANCKGLGAPRTNVARNALEETQELTTALKNIYDTYGKHVQQELQALQNERGFSITWAVGEASHLLSPLVDDFGGSSAIDNNLLNAMIWSLPLMLVEVDGIRKSVSLKEFQELPEFWTLDGAFFRFAESILRELVGHVSVTKLSQSLDNVFKVPQGVILTENSYSNSRFEQIPYLNREVDKVVIYENQRRIDLRWAKQGHTSRWLNYSEIINKKHNTNRRRRRVIETRHSELLVATTNIDIEVVGDKKYSGILSDDRIFLFQNSPISKYLREKLLDEHISDEQWILLMSLQPVIDKMCSVGTIGRMTDMSLGEFASYLEGTSQRKFPRPEINAVYEAVLESEGVFSTSFWDRRGRARAPEGEYYVE